MIGQNSCSSPHRTALDPSIHPSIYIPPSIYLSILCVLSRWLCVFSYCPTRARPRCRRPGRALTPRLPPSPREPAGCSDRCPSFPNHTSTAQHANAQIYYKISDQLMIIHKPHSTRRSPSILSALVPSLAEPPKAM